jgi:hypothetical protein
MLNALTKRFDIRISWAENEQTKERVERLNELIMAINDSCKVNSGSKNARIKASLLMKYTRERDWLDQQIIKYILQEKKK